LALPVAVFSVILTPKGFNIMTLKRSAFVSCLTGGLMLAAWGAQAAPDKKAAAKPAAKVEAEVPGLPRVLIIGDSISIGYTPFVKELFKGRANIIHAPGNNASTVVGLAGLDAWLGPKPWDVIHFNWGLHDLKYIDAQTKMTDVATGKQWVPVDQYEKNLRELVQRLKKTGARLVWCSTTPVPEGVKGRVPGDETRYNAAALKVMQAEGVQVNDLNAFVGTPQNRDAIGGKPKDVHYSDAGSKALAGVVVQAIEQALKQPKKSAQEAK
jgi:acyl-CoA thioesterase-1